MDLTRDRVADVLAEAAEAEKSELDKKEDEGEKKEEDESEKPSATPKLKAKAKAPSLKRPAASKVKPVKKQKPDEENNMFANFNPMFGGGGSLISDVNMGQSSSQRSGFLILFLLIFPSFIRPKKTPFQQACWLWSCQVPLPLLLLLRLVGSTCRSLAPAMVPSS